MVNLEMEVFVYNQDRINEGKEYDLRSMFIIIHYIATKKSLEYTAHTYPNN
jgi:hypothetical protein